MKINILEYDVHGQSYQGGRRIVQSHKRNNGKWKPNDNFIIHIRACQTPLAFNVKQYEKEVS